MKKAICILTMIMLFSSATFAQSETQEKEKKVLKPALLVIDVQKQYIPYMSKEDQEMAIEMMNWAIWIFRENNLPVIRIYHTDPEWGLNEDSPGFEFHSDEDNADDWANNLLAYFLNPDNGAKFDALAIHGYPPVGKISPITRSSKFQE